MSFIPVSAGFLGVAFLGEVFTSDAFWGIGLIALGLIVVSWPPPAAKYLAAIPGTELNGRSALLFGDDIEYGSLSDHGVVRAITGEVARKLEAAHGFRTAGEYGLANPFED